MTVIACVLLQVDLEIAPINRVCALLFCYLVEMVSKADMCVFIAKLKPRAVSD
jgi:hypothetical protein